MLMTRRRLSRIVVGGLGLVLAGAGTLQVQAAGRDEPGRATRPATAAPPMLFSKTHGITMSSSTLVDHLSMANPLIGERNVN